MKTTPELLEALGLEKKGNKYVNSRNNYFVYENKLPENAKDLIESMFGYICKTCKNNNK